MLAAINFVMNILWKENADGVNRDKRKKVLHDLAVDHKLSNLAKDSTDRELQAKALQALKFFNE